MSETSSVSHVEDLEKAEQLASGPEQSTPEAPGPEQAPGTCSPQEPEALPAGAQSLGVDCPQVEERESLR